MALKVHAEGWTVANGPNDLWAVLLADCAAALLMLNANDAAVADCQAALTFVSNLDVTITPAALAMDGGPALGAKIYIGWGKALLCLGRLNEAEQAFGTTLSTSNALLAVAHNIGYSEETEQTKHFLAQLIRDAESGKIAVNLCRNAQQELLKLGNASASCFSPTARKASMQALLLINKALEYAPGDVALFAEKLSWLALLGHFCEVAGHCE